jgi:hypothetical protein
VFRWRFKTPRGFFVETINAALDVRSATLKRRKRERPYTIERLDGNKNAVRIAAIHALSIGVRIAAVHALSLGGLTARIWHSGRSAVVSDQKAFD